MDLLAVENPNPQPSVRKKKSGLKIEKRLENLQRLWNNVGKNTSSLFQMKEAFE